jgi:hypothetical protein
MKKMLFIANNPLRMGTFCIRNKKVDLVQCQEGNLLHNTHPVRKMEEIQ